VLARRAEHRLELAAVVVLSLAVLATAWSGYHAARWSGEESRLYTQASALRVKSAEQATRAGQARIDDQLYFRRSGRVVGEVHRGRSMTTPAQQR
jgi:hypothetical protein